jgi:hypothetical protein
MSMFRAVIAGVISHHDTLRAGEDRMLAKAGPGDVLQRYEGNGEWRVVLRWPTDFPSIEAMFESANP